MPDAPTLHALREAAWPLTGADDDHDRLLELVGDAQVVLLGEASHGTHEFYRERARITRRLIDEKGFVAVALEADWPDAQRVDRWVRGQGDDRTAEQALRGFVRFPSWMWRNEEFARFVSWLRERNQGADRPAGVYGLDLYSLRTSMDEVVRILGEIDPEAAERARRRYACFDHFGDDSQTYGYATAYGVAEPCEDEVVAQLVELERWAAADGEGGDLFSAEQNARLVRNAERYYRAMFRGRNDSWNLRDEHMAETLESLCEQLGPDARIVVWEHNSHIGDARATELGRSGQLNVGQLARERHGRDAVLIGFSTYRGTVTAAHDWDLPAETMDVRPGLPGSYEDVLHQVGGEAFVVPLRHGGPAAEALAEPRLERAIGVVYRPATERQSHYFGAVLPEQYDAVIHIDETTAVVPLERVSEPAVDEPAETYPFAV